MTLTFLVSDETSYLSSEQTATERIIAGGQRNDVSDDVYHVIADRDHQTAKMNFELDSPLIEVLLSLR